MEGDELIRNKYKFFLKFNNFAMKICAVKQDMKI